MFITRIYFWPKERQLWNQLCCSIRGLHKLLVKVVRHNSIFVALAGVPCTSTQTSIATCLEAVAADWWWISVWHSIHEEQKDKRNYAHTQETSFHAVLSAPESISRQIWLKKVDKKIWLWSTSHHVCQENYGISPHRPQKQKSKA